MEAAMEQNLSQYHIFYVTARCGNISKASRELFISQPAVSKAIQKLEQTLNTVLFRRGSRGVTLTEDGELPSPLWKRRSSPWSANTP